MIVVDTCVLVSGLSSRTGRGAAVAVVDRIINGDVNFVVSMELLAEYRDVLMRPRVVGRIANGSTAIERLLALIAQTAVFSQPPRSTILCPDPDDQHLWDLLAYLPETRLLTFEKALIEDSAMAGRVIGPRVFIG